MSDGSHCPACSKDIGIWPICTAMLPNRVTCPHCQARLAYRGVAVLIVILVLLMLVLGVAAFLIGFQLPLTGLLPRMSAIVGMLLVAYLPIEIWAALYLRRNKTLSRVDQR